MWKQKSTALLLEHPRITVWEDTVELPNGHVTDYIRYQSGGDAATIIAKNLEGKILFSREYSYPVDRILWQLPGGGLLAGEDPLLGALRELREETKLTSARMTPLGSYLTNNRRSGNRVFAYLAEDLSEDPLAADLEEDIENVWLSESEIGQLIKAGEVENPHALAAWCLYKAR